MTTDESESDQQNALDDGMKDTYSSEEEEKPRKKRKRSTSRRNVSRKEEHFEEVTEYYIKIEPLTDEEPVLDLAEIREIEFEGPEENVKDKERKQSETEESEDNEEESEAVESDTEDESVEEGNPNDRTYRGKI